MSWMIILICFGASVLLTPLIRKIALYFDITDKPDQRRINIKPIPSLGGLAMFISFTIGMFLLPIENEFLWPLLIAAFVMVLTGLLDDIMEFKARYKLIGQVTAAFIIVF